ncbi:uncharacterized protein BO97DRAFT_406889 [Aspergillus homomorphus CBS 101889]|uniref:Integral membrane protein n=1 Tax=Aspergillus homomorphus (strain CBS 101889) TaxID=1450537 RepID=A0A395HSX1_ASPHC|nr:hypothetical protein BO97DRAFT_406889 [Aspergillus homomorphus CBS 101889]RAL10646.1 hypothetical protein BO97DRAFT_406889 [Aspergillus homomorphus CBS 101889]
MRALQTALKSLPVRKLRRSSAINVLLASVLLWLIAYAYCRVRFWRDPHSAFFNDRHVYEWRYSLYREHQGRRLITTHNTLSDNSPTYTKAGSDPLVCASFLTVRRDEDYLEASVGSLLEGLDPLERRALFLNIIFVDTDPTLHPGWGQKWVHRLADHVGSYRNISIEQFRHLQELEKARNFYEKGVFDYIHALEACMTTNARYFAMFEDDIILADGWMAQTLKGLSDIARERQTQQGNNNNNNNKNPWLYLRLFFTETALSWTSSDFAYRNMGWVFVGASSLLLAALLTIRRSYPITHTYLDNPTIGVLSCISLPALIALIYMVGKYSLMPLSGVVEMNAHGCCTQGLIFPRDQVDALIAHLTEVKAGQTDSIIEEYADATRLTRYALAPQQLQHVGLKSSRDNLEINTRSTWAFWFEENKPEVLRREHEALLRDGDVRRFLDEQR